MGRTRQSAPLLAAHQIGERTEDKRAGRDAPEKEIGGNIVVPCRRLQDRYVLVGITGVYVRRAFLTARRARLPVSRALCHYRPPLATATAPTALRPMPTTALHK